MDEETLLEHDADIYGKSLIGDLLPRGEEKIKIKIKIKISPGAFPISKVRALVIPAWEDSRSLHISDCPVHP